MKRSLLIYAFLAMVTVALLSVGLAGVITRAESSSAFDNYVQQLPGPGAGMGAGRHLMIGGAEQTFLASLDRGILVSTGIAIALAALAALAFAYYLTRSLTRLSRAAEAISGGDLAHRVEIGGPAEVRQLGGSFNDMADSLGRSEELRRRMVADVAHELRNPIASLRAQVEGMAEGVLTTDGTRLAAVVDDTLALSRLVDDLQELTAADAGQLAYRMERFDLGDLAVAEAGRAQDRAGAAVCVSAPHAAACPVVADPGRITQVLRNLLDNAVRHTDSGSITVTVSCAETIVTAEVTDTGEGIPEADLPLVFERFYRADAARARARGGSGLGLAIARRIVEDHGGEMFARRNDSGGATVGFTLPAAD